MRKTLNERYLELKKEFDEYKNELADRINPGCQGLVGKNLYVFHSSPRHPSKEPEIWDIRSVSAVLNSNYSRENKVKAWMPTGRITKVLIKEVEDFLEGFKSIPVERFDLFLDLYRETNGCRCSTGLRYRNGKFEDGNNQVFFDPSGIEEKYQSDLKLYEEMYKPREGYVACERCGKQVPIGEETKYKLIYQAYDYNKRKCFVTSRMGTFCSGKCAVEEQMSLEG